MMEIIKFNPPKPITVKKQVALCGTRAHSTWRIPIIKILTNDNINYVTPNHDYEDCVRESKIIMIAITDEDYSMVELSGIGYILADILSFRKFRIANIYIDKNINKELSKNRSLYINSIIARIEAWEFISKMPSNLINTFENMEDFNKAATEIKDIINIG